jgi:hypothetical protein
MRACTSAQLPATALVNKLIGIKVVRTLNCFALLSASLQAPRLKTIASPAAERKKANKPIDKGRLENGFHSNKAACLVGLPSSKP